MVRHTELAPDRAVEEADGVFDRRGTARVRSEPLEEVVAPRGAGFWLWKPWLVLRQLQKMAEGELLLYTDAGMLFVGDVAGLLERFAVHESSVVEKGFDRV